MARTIPTLLFAAFLLCTGGRSFAQNKFACISITELVNSMPETQKADTALAQYQAALQQEFDGLKSDYSTQATELASRDTLKFTKAQLELKRRSLGELLSKLQGFDQEAGNLLNQKRSDLFAPIQRKAEDAITQVAHDNNYTFVFEKENLHYYPPSDDILPLVKKKLGLAVASR
ncbi:MAG TPA: OmpH family outer membrane protein [Puia sp.]|nr:OmpH family outer membrane protein [Puia sp.]